MIGMTDTVPHDSQSRWKRLWYAMTTGKRIQKRKSIIQSEILETFDMNNSSVFLAFSSESPMMDTENPLTHALLFPPLSHEEISSDSRTGPLAGSL